jgi:hypothetical protein
MVVHFLSPAGTCRTIRSEKQPRPVTRLSASSPEQWGYVQVSGMCRSSRRVRANGPLRKGLEEVSITTA